MFGEPNKNFTQACNTSYIYRQWGLLSCICACPIFHLFSSLQNRFEALSSGSRDKFGGVHSNDADSEQTISQIKYGKNT